MNDKEEEREEQGNVEESETKTNTAPSAQDLEAIKAELDEERKAKAEIIQAMAERATSIAQLEAELSEAKKASEAVTAELAQLKDAHSKAISKYLEAVKLANTHLPSDVIAGTTIEEIDASVAKALSIAESVKKALQEQARETKVPAGAPPRAGIPLESLSPREKIIAGLTKTGGP